MSAKLQIGYAPGGFDKEYSNERSFVSIWEYTPDIRRRVAEVLLKTTCGPMHLPMPIEEQGEARKLANVIVAAPELLEALEECLVCMDLANWHDDQSAMKARAAIAKAKGGSA